MKLFWRRQHDPERASEWFARVRSGKISPRADRAWAKWMAARMDNETAYDDRELAWELTEELRHSPRIQALLEDVDTILARPRAARRHAALSGYRLSWQLGVAVVVLAVGVSAYYLVNRKSISEYTTGIGELRVVTLADNSTASLNTATKIRVVYSRAARHIDLLEGEAFFSVTADRARHFEVRARNGVTTATGTQFDVRIDRDDVSVAVLEGTVTVGASGNVSDDARTSVTAGQAVDYLPDGTLSALRPADAARIRGWQAHRIVFSNLALAEAVREYNRYIAVPIVVGSPELATRRVNGVFQVGDQDAFLGALQRGLNVKVSKTETQILLQSP
ncbi:MAG: FecR domain-containing protein [Gammaproteobacteria bacterium]